MNIRKHLIFICTASIIMIHSAYGQEKTTVTAKNSDISDNLDLEAVASAFGESKDLEDFEKKLNDPDLQLSNLDLNEDGNVDYLRVVSSSKGNTHVVNIQAVIGEDQFQDVATIDVEKKDQKTTTVQVVGSTYIYGPQYIIEPVYVRPPIIFTWFWGPLYRPWISPWYWGYYPPYFRPWRPFPPYTYRNNVHVHINVNHTYRHTNVRRSNTAINIHNDISRRDYANRHPDRSFSSRNTGVSNRQDLVRSRPATTNPGTRDINRNQPVRTPTNNTRRVDPNWNRASTRPSTRTSTRQPVPSGAWTGSRPSNTGSYRPPSTRNYSRPSTTRPSGMPSQGRMPRGTMRRGRGG